MIALLLALTAQDGEVDRLLAAHEQRMRGARLPADQRRVLEETRGKLDAFVAAHPRHADTPRARWHAAESFLALGGHTAALDRLRALVKEHPDSAPASNARFAVGEVLLEKEDWTGAKAAFDDFLKNHAKDERAFFAKALTATACQGEGDYDRAVELLRAARNEHKERPESWGALLQAAAARHAQGKNEDARRLLDDVIQTCPDRETQDVARLHLTAYLKLGTEQPAVAGKDPQGVAAGTDRFTGKVGLLYFFDSTLQPAVDEARFLRGLQAPELSILGVSVDLEKKDLALFAGQKHADWPLVWDGKGFDGPGARAYDVRRLPSLWVFDRKGRLRYHNLAGADLRRAIATLLQEK